MSTCKDCICYDACNYHIDEETCMTVNECSTGFKHKDQYVKLPAHIGLEVWLPWVYISPKEGIHIVKLDEGKVSGLQQKVDGSWKIRISNKRRGTVADYTVEEFNKKVFTVKESADKYIEEKIKEYENVL